MQQYLDMMRLVRDEGARKEDRTGPGTEIGDRDRRRPVRQRLENSLGDPFSSQTLFSFRTVREFDENDEKVQKSYVLTMDLLGFTMRTNGKFEEVRGILIQAPLLWVDASSLP